MRIFVTGSDGFTGRHFISRARAGGNEVVPLQASLADRPGMTEELVRAKADAVVHLAAIAFVGHSEVSAFYDVNVLGTTNLLDALVTMEHRPKVVLLASSANIYGNSDASPINEIQSPAPVNHYAMSKLAMEYMARNYMDKLPIVIARPFNYTGVGQSGSFVIPKLVSHFRRKAPEIELGNLEIEREFNDVRTVCEVYLGLLEKGVPGECYNICSGNTYKLRQAIILLEEMTNHKIEVRVNPALMRVSEVHSLCGSPAKLEAAIGLLRHYNLKETLKWMLDES